MNNSSIGASQNSPVIQNPVSQQQMPKRRIAPQRPSGRSITVETENLPSSNTPASNKADFPKSAWTSAKVNDHSRARFGQEGSPQIGHRKLMQKQRAITEHAVKLAELQQIKKAYTEALSHLDTIIAKTEKSADRILLRSSSKQRLASELEAQKEVRSSHENAIKQIDTQIGNEEAQISFIKADLEQDRLDKAAIPLMKDLPKGWAFSVKDDGQAAPPGAVNSPQKMFHKTVNNYMTSANDEAFGTVLKDIWRGADKIELRDERNGPHNGAPLIDARARSEEITSAGKTKDAALGEVIKEELRSIASLTLSPEDQTKLDKLINEMEGNWGNLTDLPKMGAALHAARKDGTFTGNTENFFRLLNVMRTASRLDILAGVARTIPAPQGLSFNLANTEDLVNYPYKTTVKFTEQGVELSYSLDIFAKRANDRTTLATCPLTVTYSFDQNMNLQAITGQPGEFDFNVK